MSLPFQLTQGSHRLLREIEYDLARQDWQERQVTLIASGAPLATLDEQMFAGELLWTWTSAALAAGASFHSVLNQLDDIGPPLPELRGISIAHRRTVSADVKSGLARMELYFPSFPVGGSDFEHSPICELADAHAACAGVTRYLLCGHHSKRRPSARVALLLDPALNLGEELDDRSKAETTSLLVHLPGLTARVGELERVLVPVRVTAVRPRIWKNPPRNLQGRGLMGSSSRFAKMSFAEICAQIMADCPHKSDLPTHHSTAGLTWVKGTQDHFHGFSKLLVKHFGERPVASLLENDWHEFFAMLHRLPKTHHKSKFDRERSLEEICAIAAGRVAAGTLSPAQIGIGPTAINRNVSFCRTIYSYFERHVELYEINWTLFLEPRPKPSRDRAYLLEEMSQLFRIPVFHGRSAPSGAIRAGRYVWHNASYWVPIILAYSGARVGELCGLRTQDIKQRAGIWYMELRDQKARSLKRTASIRDVPLHPEILRLGFIAFVDAIGKAGEDRLFPELYSPGRAITSGFVELVGPFLKRLLPFMVSGELTHPIRHYVYDQLRLADVCIEVRQALTGHRGKEELEERRGRLPNLKRLLSAIARLPILTAHLEPHAIRLHPKALRKRKVRRKKTRLLQHQLALFAEGAAS